MVRGDPPTQIIAGEQITRTLLACKTHNFLKLRREIFWSKTRGTAILSLYYLYKDVTMEQPEFNEEEQLSDVEKMELERMMIDVAYDNSYMVLTNKVAFEDLLDEKHDVGISTLMAYDPNRGIKREELENIISYYIDIDKTEYYLRCAELKRILDETFPDHIN